MTEVRIIETDRKNGAVLVEWMEEGRFLRSIVPADQVVQGHCDHPEWGLPVGEDWAAMLADESIDTAAIAHELNRRGIFTIEDLQRQHKAALGAIQSVAASLLAVLLAKSKALKAQGANDGR